jgi:hypothetical protein
VEHADYPDSPVFYVSDGMDFDSVHALIKGDVLVQVETPWAYRSPQQLRALLPEPGMFTFQRYRSSVLWYIAMPTTGWRTASSDPRRVVG